MKLTEEQIVFYNDNGYLKIENYLTEDEVKLLCQELPKTVERKSPRIILEDNGDVCSIFAPHFVNDVYSRLDRLIVPAEQLLLNKIYLHQYKINTKKKLKGEY